MDTMNEKKSVFPQRDENAAFAQECCRVLGIALTTEYAANKNLTISCAKGQMAASDLFGYGGMLVVLLTEVQERMQGNTKFDLDYIACKKAICNILPEFVPKPGANDSDMILSLFGYMYAIREAVNTEIDDDTHLEFGNIYERNYEKLVKRTNLGTTKHLDEIHFNESNELVAGTEERKWQERLQSRILKLRTALLGAAHSETLKCYVNLGVLRHDLGLEDEALSNFRAAYGAAQTSKIDLELEASIAYNYAFQLSRSGKPSANNEALSILGELVCKGLPRSEDLTNAELLLEKMQQTERLTGKRSVRVCGEKEFENRLKRETDKDRVPNLNSLQPVTRMKRLPNINDSMILAIRQIGLEQPNFSKVTDVILNTLHAQAIAGRPARLPPLLISGAPGIGKTRFIKRIATALGLPFVDIQMAGTSDGFRIVGLSRYWGSGSQGMIVDAFVNHEVANPVFLFDEIDKTRADNHTDPLSILLLLLEQESSKDFKDSFLEVPLDVSHASFIATGNDVSRLPEPLLSRFLHVEIDPLDYGGRCTMVRTTYTELLQEEGLDNHLESILQEEVVDYLANSGVHGRELKREILSGMQRACQTFRVGQPAARKSFVTKESFQFKAEIKRSIGFV